MRTVPIVVLVSVGVVMASFSGACSSQKNQGTQGRERPPAQAEEPEPAQAKKDQAAQVEARQPALAGEQAPAQIEAALCRSDAARKTIRIVPWDSEKRQYRKNRAKLLSWRGTTELISGPNRLTMAQLISGKPLDEDVKCLADLHGERAILHVAEVNGEELIQKMQMILIFGGESIPGYVTFRSDGSTGFEALGAGKVPCCDEEDGD